MPVLELGASAKEASRHHQNTLISGCCTSIGGPEKGKVNHIRPAAARKGLMLQLANLNKLPVPPHDLNWSHFPLTNTLPSNWIGFKNFLGMHSLAQHMQTSTLEAVRTTWRAQLAKQPHFFGAGQLESVPGRTASGDSSQQLNWPQKLKRSP